MKKANDALTNQKEDGMKSQNDKCKKENYVDFLRQIENAGSLDDLVKLAPKMDRFEEKVLEQIEQALTKSALPHIQNALTAVLFSENFISVKGRNRFLTEYTKINGVKSVIDIGLLITAIAKDKEGNSAELLEDTIKIAAKKIGFSLKGNLDYTKLNNERRLKAARLMRKLAGYLSEEVEFVFLTSSDLDFIPCKCPACTVKKMVAENPANHYMVQKFADFTIKLLREGLIVDGHQGLLPNCELKSLMEKAKEFGLDRQIINSLKEWFTYLTEKKRSKPPDDSLYITKDVLEDLEVFLSFHQMKGTIGKLLFQVNGKSYTLNELLSQQVLVSSLPKEIVEVFRRYQTYADEGSPAFPIN